MHCRLLWHIPDSQEDWGLLADDLVRSCKIIFAEYGLPVKIMSDSTNLVSENFQEFCRKLKTHHAVLSSYYHQSNEQVAACIKFVKCTMKKYFDANKDVNLAFM